jgi:hypothetical protein
MKLPASKESLAISTATIGPWNVTQPFRWSQAWIAVTSE